MVHFNLGDMGTNNTVVWSMSGGSLTHNALMRVARDDQGAAYGYADTTFEVIGSAPTINTASFKSGQTATLRYQINDASGVSAINASSTAILNSGGIIDMVLDGYTPYYGDVFTLLSASGGITDNGIGLSLEDQASWSILDTSGGLLQVQYIPEPTTLALLVGGLFFARSRRKK
jgi:hypothetical protein